MLFRFFTLFSLTFSLNLSENNEPIPLILWHGMGDSCCNPFSMGSIKKTIELHHPGIYVRSLMMGNNVIEDTMEGFLGDVNSQIDEVCRKIKQDPKLSNGYNAMGFSQGGQFLRALAQRCDYPKMNNLISIGGQHQGVFGLPHCPGGSMELCNFVRKELSKGAYLSAIQNHIVQAQYWHDPLNLNEYRQKSIFLSDINQELKINQTYRKNLLKLKNFVMVLFNKDTMVQPKESEWFGFYKPNQAVVTESLRESEIYTQDKLGLKVLDKSNRLHFLQVDGDHLQINETFLVNEIIKKFV